MGVRYRAKVSYFATFRCIAIGYGSRYDISIIYRELE